MDTPGVCPDFTKEECEAFLLIVDHFVVSSFWIIISGRVCISADFLFSALSCGKEVTGFGICEFTKWRISGLPTQALSQESRQKWSVKHGSPQTLVRFQERTAPHGKKESDSSY